MVAFRMSSNTITRWLAMVGTYVCSALSLQQPAWPSSQPTAGDAHAVTVAPADANVTLLIDELSDGSIFDAVLRDHRLILAWRRSTTSTQPQHAMKLKSRQPQQAMKLKSRQPQQAMKLKSRQPQQAMKLKSRQPQQAMKLQPK
jgi:hypothetical protein